MCYHIYILCLIHHQRSKMQKEYFGDVISKTNIVEYTDIQGFKRIFERQNNEENVTKQSFRSKNMFKLNDENSNTTNLENNTKKHIENGRFFCRLLCV